MSLFQVAYAKAGTVLHRPGQEIVRVSTNSSSEVTSIISASEILNVGWQALADAVVNAGFTIEGATAAEVMQSFGRTTIFRYMKISCNGEECKSNLTRIISSINDLAGEKAEKSS